MVKRVTRMVGDFGRQFIDEQGQFLRREVQDLGPAMRRSADIRESMEASGVGRQFDRRYVGSIPITVLHDWLKKHGYRMDEFARNEGGDPYKSNPHTGGGVKDKFLKYFLSRDFAKLHTQHTTTRRESNRIVVPEHIGQDNDRELPRTTDGDS